MILYLIGRTLTATVTDSNEMIAEGKIIFNANSLHEHNKTSTDNTTADFGLIKLYKTILRQVLNKARFALIKLYKTRP